MRPDATTGREWRLARMGSLLDERSTADWARDKFSLAYYRHGQQESGLVVSANRVATLRPVGGCDWPPFTHKPRNPLGGADHAPRKIQTERVCGTQQCHARCQMQSRPLPPAHLLSASTGRWSHGDGAWRHGDGAWRHGDGAWRPLAWKWTGSRDCHLSIQPRCAPSQPALGQMICHPRTCREDKGTATEH
jgi:hypothetical protein